MLLKSASDSILVHANRAPPRLESVRAPLAAALRGKAAEAYIFGSVADGTAQPASDIDLLVVSETGLPFVERAMEFGEVYSSVPYPIDMLVYTPEEFRRLWADGSPGFWSSLHASARRIL